MNRIFRIIWSQALRTWVVASELTKRRGKGSSVDKRVDATATAFDGAIEPPTVPWQLQLSILIVLSALQAPTWAADKYWDSNGSAVGSGGTGTWNTTSAFWNDSSDGVAGPFTAWDNAALNHAIFGGTAGTVTLDSPITANRLTFNVPSYTLTGGTLTLSGTTPTIFVQGGTTTIASAITGDAGLTKSGNGNLTLSGPLSFTGGLNITGANWLTLSGNNSFSGGITLASGGLSATTDAALGAAGNGITVTGASTLIIGSGTANRTVDINSGVTLTLQGAGTGSALFTGAGNVSLVNGVTMSNDANTYTGTTRINGAIGGAASIQFTSLRNLGEASSLGAPTTVANGTITFTGGNTYSDSVIYIGDGDSSNRNWVMGGSTLRRFFNRGTGTLTITGDIAMGQSVSYEAQDAGIDLLGVLSGGGSPTFNASAAQNITLGGAHTFTGAPGIAGAGVVSAPVFADAGTASSLGAGSTTVGVSGTLSYTGAAASSNRNWSFTGGTLRNDGTGALALSGNTSLGGNLTLGGSFTGAGNTISGVVSGSGDLVGSGPATWVLSGANTRTGAITLQGGTLRAGSASAFGTTTGVTINGGTLDLNGFGLSTTSLNGSGGTLALGGANLSLNLGTGVNNAYSGSITGTGGSLTKLGAGVLTLRGANTYTGATTVNGGTLALDFSPAGGPTSNIVSDASTLNLGGGVLNVIGAAGENNTQTFNGLNITAGNNTVRATSGTGGSTTINLGGVTRTGGLANFALPTVGAITTTNGDGVLGGWATVNGADYAKVQGGNIVAFTADDYVNKDNAFNWLNNEIISDAGGDPNTAFSGTVNGSVQIGGLQYTAAAPSTVTVGGGNVLGVDGTIIVAPSVGDSLMTITGGSLTGTLGGGVLGVQQNGGTASNFTIGSQIVDNSGSIGFTKAGTGKATLTGSNTYTGATTVSQGMLSVNSIASGGVASAIGASTADASNLLIQGATLEYTGGTASSDRGFTIERSGAVTSSTIAVTNAAANLTFSGQVVSPDGANLIKSGPGTLTLANGSNSYTGTTTISGGTLAATTLANGGTNSSIGASGSGSSNLVLQSGGELEYLGATAATNRGFTLGTGGGAIDVTQNATTLTMSGVAAGSGTLSKNGAGTLILSGINTFTGGGWVNGGTLRAGSTQAFGTGSWTVASGATLDFAGFDNTIRGLVGAGQVNLGSATLTTNGNGTFTGTVSGTGGLTVAAGTQTMTGCNNDYAGATTISGGALSTNCLANGGEASGIGASGSASSNLVIGAATLSYTGGTTTTDRGFTVTSVSSSLNVVNSATTLGFTGQVTGAGRVRKGGAGTLVLSGTNDYTGGTVVDGGTLRAGSTSAFGTGGVTVNAATATLDLAGFDNTVNFLTGNAGHVSLGSATLTLTGGTSATYLGTIDGSGGLVKNGAGVQSLGGCNNTYDGSTRINGGFLAVACLENGGVASSIGDSSTAASNLVIDGGALAYVGSGSSTDRQMTLGTAGGTLIASGSGTVAFTSTAAMTLAGINTARTLTIQGLNTGSNTLAAQITDNGTGATSLTKTGTGTWVLTNPGSTYTGVTTISGGVLAVDKLSNGDEASSIGASSSAASNLVIGNGSTLRYTGAGDTTDRLFSLDTGVTFIEASGTGAVVFANTDAVVQTGTGARTIALGGINTGDNTLGGSIGNSASGITTLAKNGSGKWVLTGNSTFSGSTIINGGILQLGNGGTTGSLASANIVNDAGTLAFNRSDTSSYAGVISGAGDVRQDGSGTTVLTGANTYAGGTTISAGTLQLGNGGATGSIVGNVLNNGALAFNRSNTYTFGGLISGSGALNQIGGGTTVLTGSNTYGGATTVQAGTLFVNGDQSGATGLTTVQNGGTLGGTGVIGGTVTIADGGALNPGNSPGTLTINGDLNLNAGSILNYEFGQADVVGGPLNDLTVVQGNLVLDGTLNVAVTPGGSFGPGLYRIISYGGGLTDNGLELGTMPPGVFQVQTSVANQVNLLNTGGLTLNFWDGDAGPKADGTIQGGNGSWQSAAGNDNWTDQTGTYNAPYTDGEFAIFMGSPGTVTVDNSLGAVRTSGMQFAVDGYTVTGDTLTLADGSSIVRVGDGTGAGTGMTATIDAALAGNSALVKADLGTLVLSGTNTYTGGTTIEGGTLQVSSDANLGDAAGALAIDGGMLRNTSAFTSARTVTLEENGGTFQTLADLGLDGTIGGAGALNKTGAGTLTLTGINTYAGGTSVTGGTLSVSSDANLGDATGAVVLDGGTLRNTAGFASSRTITLGTGGGTLQTVADLTLNGALGGSGALTKTDGGKLTLTGDNTYTGGTTIAGGTLQLGAGGTTGSILGDVFNHGALVFDRSDIYTFSGLISGSGALEQVGAGITVLTGNHSYAGPTAVRAGSLIVNGDQSAATGATTVDNGGTLGGNGTIGGNVAVDDGGTLNPGDLGSAPGTLTINGDLALSDGSLLNYDFGQANVEGGPFNDLIRIGGDLVLDGTLNVSTTPGGDFGAGIYRIMGYEGTLTDNGLTVGTVPSPEYFLQTSVAQQVNLVNTAGLSLNFWDGQGNANDGTIQGGDGVWQGATGNENWTDDTGALNAPYRDGDFAIFTGTAGMVTVDNGLGDVTASGMQFAVDGYTIDGDALTLVGSDATIRVGDGTTEAAGMTAIIAAQLTGTAALTKTDLGTLVLAGDNSYSGGTTIAQGTLQLGNGGTTGSVLGDVLNNGTLAFDRGDTYAFDGLISGSGGVLQAGTGTTVLTGGNSYSGTTAVQAGTLRIDGDQSGATGLTTVASGGTLGGAGTIGGNVSVADGGTLAPSAGGGGAASTLTINGGLSLGDGSLLDYRFGEANVEGGPLNDLVRVGGDLVLGGTLNVTTTPGGSFDAGIYRIFSYGGTLTDNGLAVGTAPSTDVYVQTSVANQVNLVNTAGLTLNFWDGTGGANNGAIGGGSGIWRVGGGDTWTDSAGTVNAPYANGAFAVFMGAAGTVTVDNGGGQLQASGLQFAVDGYVIDGDALELTGTTSTIRVGDGTVDGADMTATVNAVLTGAAALAKTDLGTLVLGGANTYTGATTVQAGTLRVDGDQSGATGLTTVASGAMLGGAGTIGGDVSVADGGTLTPGVGGAASTLTINGGLSLAGGSLLDYRFGEANVEGGSFNDLVRVGGDLVLDGTLNVSTMPGGSFDAGIYRIFSYGGTLTDNGLALGTAPSTDVFVQTAVANQVNLVNTAGLTLNFWDGTGGANNGTIDGGSGSWRLDDNSDWTDSAGALNAPYANGAFAVFMSTPGTVAVDNANGQVQASGLQFAVDGYVIDGDALELTGTTSTIRVGDGSAAGANVTATVNAALVGDSAMVKADLGTLALTGTNAYTGGTTLQAGTLQVSRDANLGAASGDLTFAGGTLHTTASFQSGRTVNLAGTGTFLTDTATVLTLSGGLSGAGGMSKTGDGTLLLSGTASYGGATTVAAGTLQAGVANAFSAASAHTVLGTGTLDLAGFSQTVGALVNAGSVRLSSTAPGTVLSVNGNYTGNGGTLFFNTVLGGDSSATDRLAVAGDTSGTTQVRVNNVGGAGAQTVEGIKLIDVAGASNGSFSLVGDYVFQGEQAVVAGAYAYRLYKNGVSTPSDGDWYLRSALTDGGGPGPNPEPPPLYQAGVPVYEAYAGALQAFNALGTLHQRTGNRAWSGPQAESSAPGEGLWVHAEGMDGRYRPEVTTSGTTYDLSAWKVEVGVDTVLAESANGVLTGGVGMHYGRLTSDASSIYGDGRIEIDGHGLAASMTWYGANNVYVDGQARVALYQADLYSRSLNQPLATGNDGQGYVLGVETGRRIVLGERWSLTPQAQLTYARTEFSNFQDAFGVPVSMEKDRSVMGRVGLAADYRNTWQGSAGAGSSRVYGVANLYREFADGTSVDVSGTALATRNEKLWGGLGLGGAVDWAGGRFSIYGEVLAKTGLDDFGDSHTLNGTLGFRMRW